MKKNILIFLIILITNSCQWLTDNSDKAELQRHFEIPDDAELIAYDGFPTMVGFGQREGLSISAKYNLNDDDINTWIKSLHPKGLEKLPISTQCRNKLWFKDKLVPLDTKNGYYYCRTAGNDVLKATETKSCDEVENLIDIIFAILDTDKKELSVIVTSGY